MGFALVLRELLKRRLLLAAGVIIAAVAATLSIYSVHGFSLKPRGLQHSSASTQVIVDSNSSFLGDLSGKLEPLNVRAMVYANLLATPALLDLIGEGMGISGSQIYAAGPVDPVESIIVQEPTALKRNVQVTGETHPYRLNYTANLNLPTIGINAQAPTTKQAIGLANGAAVALQHYVAGLQRANRVPAVAGVTIRQLGQANGAVANAGISKTLAGLVFVAVFFVWCGLVLLANRFRENWRASAALYVPLDDLDPHAVHPDASNGNGHADVHAVPPPPDVAPGRARVSG